MSDLKAGRTGTGGSRADQVVRRQCFEAAHPGVTIVFTSEPWTWTATCQVNGHEHVVNEHELRDLLDKLERLTSTPEPAC